jgi:hypothetical protein
MLLMISLLMCVIYTMYLDKQDHAFTKTICLVVCKLFNNKCLTQLSQNGQLLFLLFMNPKNIKIATLSKKTKTFVEMMSNFVLKWCKCTFQ